MMNKKLTVLLLTLLSAIFVISGCKTIPVVEPPKFSGEYQDITAFVTDEITVPTVEYTEGATLTISVNAPDGSAVEVVDGKFTLETAGVYVITYVASVAELTSEMQIKVTATLNDQKPEITLGGSNMQTVLLGEEVALVGATAKDAIGGELTVVIAVTDASGAAVTVADNKFTASVLGDYTVTYSAEDKYGNKQEIVNTINCYKLPDPIAPVPAGVANSFETEEECYLEGLNNGTAAYTVERNNTDVNANGVRSGAYSLKLSAASGGTFNLLSEVINGSQNLSEIANISFWAYNPLEKNYGFSIYKVILKDGTSVTPNLYKVIKAGEWAEYSLNLMDCGFTAEQLKKVYAVQLWSEAGLTEVYIDDISFDLRSDYPAIGEVAESVVVKINAEMQIEVPAVNEGAEISYKLTDAEGNEVPVTDGKWTPTVAGNYTLTYTATKNGHVATATTTVIVADKPVITLGGENVAIATVGDEITVASATAKDFFNQDIAVAITVTDANGDEVTLTEGKFTASVVGEYTVKYLASDASGNASEITNVIECKPEPVSKGEVPEGVANSFETEEECYIDKNTANSGGYTITHNSTNDNADAVRSGAYSLRVQRTGTKNFNLVAETIVGSQDLSEIANISFWVYNPNETAQGMSIYGIVFTDGTSIRTEVYKSIPAKSWYEFTYNYAANEATTAEKLESVFSIQFWLTGTLNDIYIDDISFDLRSDYPTMGEVAESVVLKINAEMQIEVPAVNEGAEISYKLTDAEGNEVPVTDGKWTPTVAGSYTLTYTATKNGHVATATTSITVADKPVITLDGENVAIATVGDEITVASATAKDFFNQDIAVAITVTDANGDEVTLTEGKFTASVIGEYTVKYLATDASGNVSEIINVIECKGEPVSKGEVPEGVVNSFETEEECYIAESSANSGGHTLTHNSTNDNADGVRSGAYSLKVENSGSKNFNLVAETILGGKDLSEVGKISFWIYNPKDTAQGMSLYGIVFTDGTSVKTEVYKNIPAKSWWEFSYNYTTNEAITEEKLKSVFSIQFWGIKEVYIDDISVVYRKDIKPAEPANTAISFESFGAAFTATNIAMNADPQYVIDGSLSLQMTLANSSSEWSVAKYSRWSQGIRFTEDYNAITMQVYASQAVRVTFLVGAGGNSGGASYLGFSNTKAYALEEGWNEVTINFDTDITEKTAPIKEGIVYFGAQAVIDSYEGPGSLANMIVNNSGAVLYVDAVLAVNVETPDLTPPSKGEVPEGVVNSFETEEECLIAENTENSGGYTVTHNSTNDNADGVRSGAYSLHVVNSGSKNFNLVAETILGSQDLSEVAKISFWIYNPLETSQGMSLYRTVLKNGTALNTEVYKSIPAKSWFEFTYDYSANSEITREQLASVFSIQFWGIKDIYIDDISVVYREKVVVDFESFTEIASGAASSAAGGAGISLNTDSAKAKSGSNSIKIVANQSCQVHFKPGGIFGFEDLSAYSAVEFYVYCDTAKAFNLMTCATSSGGSISYAINTTLKAGEWNKITIDLTNEVMTTLKIWSFKFWMSGGEGIVFYVDDITLIPA